MIGARGAIAGVLDVHLVLNPRGKVVLGFERGSKGPHDKSGGDLDRRNP